MLNNGVMAAAKAAMADRKPVTQMGTAFTRPENYNWVRHYLLADGSYQAEGVGAVPKSDLIGHATVADNLLQAVRFTREGGKDVVLMNWQGHPPGPDPRTIATGNYYSVMRTYVDKNMDCHSVFVFGGSGNLNNNSQIEGQVPHENYIELGENLAAKMVENFGQYPNFSIVCDDFITHDFEEQKFDLIYSAATIQWIPEQIAFEKTFSLLKPGGVLAMMLTKSDYRTPNEELYENIQKVYAEHWHPVEHYTQKGFGYANAVDYGYIGFERREYHGRRVMSAEEYVAFSGTHCDHIDIPEPHRTPFFEGLRNAVLAAGDRIVFEDTYVLMLVRKPQ
jgi:hypothetical protein